MKGVPSVKRGTFSVKNVYKRVRASSPRPIYHKDVLSRGWLFRILNRLNW